MECVFINVKLKTMKSFKFTIRGNEYEVDVKKFENGLAKIDVNGTSYEVELHKDEKTSKDCCIHMLSVY
jgi:hypothetical protein